MLLDEERDAMAKSRRLERSTNSFSYSSYHTLDEVGPSGQALDAKASEFLGIARIDLFKCSSHLGLILIGHLCLHRSHKLLRHMLWIFSISLLTMVLSTFSLIFFLFYISM